MMDILEKLKNWFNEMTTRFPGISFKYELSSHNLYKVVYYTTSDIESDELYKSIMKFEDEMEECYGDNGPLFCENEEYFKLSENAITYQKPQKFTNIMVPTSYSWNTNQDYISYAGDEPYMFYSIAA